MRYPKSPDGSALNIILAVDDGGHIGTSVTTLLVLLEDCVRNEFGAPLLDSLRADVSARPEGGSTLEKARDFLAALAQRRKHSIEDTYRWAGMVLAAPVLKLGLPTLKEFSSTRTLLLKMHVVLPQAMSVVVPGVTPPDVWEDLLNDHTTRVSFDGPEEMALVLEGAAVGLGAHFRELVTVTRGTPPATLTSRRLVDVSVRPERRSGSGSPPPPPVGERRKSMLSGFNTFLR